MVNVLVWGVIIEGKLVEGVSEKVFGDQLNARFSLLVCEHISAL